MDDKEFVGVMTESIKTNKYICDSFQDSKAKNLILYKKLITLVVVAFTICIIAVCSSFTYNTYKTYDYEGYPETELEINNNSSSIINEKDKDKEE